MIVATARRPRPHPPRAVEGRARGAAWSGAHHAADEAAGGGAASDDRPAAGGRLQHHRHHRRRIHPRRPPASAAAWRLPYNNFDNPTMYALLVLILGFAAGINALLGALEQSLHRAGIGRMSARIRILDYALLAAVLLVVWIALLLVGGPGSAVAAAADLRPRRRISRQRRLLGPCRSDRHRLRLCLPHRARRRRCQSASCWASTASPGEVGEPILSSLYSIPKITLYPVILLIFGLGISAKIAFGALHGFFPVALFTIGAMKNTSPVLLKTARVLRLSPLARHPHRVPAGRHAGDRHRTAHRLFHHAARHADRRTVRLRPRRRLHPHPRHGRRRR